MQRTMYISNNLTVSTLFSNTYLALYQLTWLAELPFHGQQLLMRVFNVSTAHYSFPEPVDSTMKSFSNEFGGCLIIRRADGPHVNTFITWKLRRVKYRRRSGLMGVRWGGNVTPPPRKVSYAPPRKRAESKNNAAVMLPQLRALIGSGGG